MSESQRVPELPEGAYIRRVTMADKEEVLRIHNNVQDGLDDLPAYYDYLTSLPDMYPVAVVCDEKMVRIHDNVHDLRRLLLLFYAF